MRLNPVWIGKYSPILLELDQSLGLHGDAPVLPREMLEGPTQVPHAGSDGTVAIAVAIVVPNLADYFAGNRVAFPVCLDQPAAASCLRPLRLKCYAGQTVSTGPLTRAARQWEPAGTGMLPRYISPINWIQVRRPYGELLDIGGMALFWQ